MFRKASFLLVLFILAGILAACAQMAQTPGPDQPSQLVLSDCQLSSQVRAAREPARCGTIQVFEDHTANSGRQIELYVAVIPAVSRSPEPDPVVFLAGGPGEAATESYLAMSGAFERLHQKRDILLVDQRGTGKSAPLACQNLEPADETALADDNLTPFIQHCLEGLDANPALYTTAAHAQDLDLVRQALGYEQVNLYGISYGTRAAQTYMKLFPERVRSVILDGVVPQAEILGVQTSGDAQRALDLIFQRCQQDAQCNQAFPQVSTEFNEMVAKLRQAPVELTLRHPTSGELTDVRLGPDELASAVRLFTYSPETAALLPLLIHTTTTTQDYTLLAAQYLLVSDQLLGSISTGLNYSVLCAEDTPFFDPAAIEQESQGSYLADQQTRLLTEICATWPQGEIASDFKEPVQSDTPVLLLSGEADPVTPPENGAEVAQFLPNSLHLVAPGQGHGVLFRGCVSRIATKFIEAASVEGLEADCVQEMQPMPFFLNFAGPVQSQ